MAALYADENVSYHLVDALRALGHDVLTARDDGRSNQGIDDPRVLARATVLGRAVLTNNRRHFHKLHRTDPQHAGVVSYTKDNDYIALAARIDAAIATVADLAGQLIRVIRPSKPTP